jgi:CheY-like chemotaxis protein
MKASNYDILYVDDEQNNLEGFKAAFRRDYRIALALSAMEGLEILAKNEDIPIILSDQRMPQITGAEFFKEICNEYPDSIRILITGYTDLEATIEAINDGKIFYYIAKPIYPPDVKIILQKAMDTFNLQMNNKILTKERENLLIKSEREEKELIKAQLQNLRSHINPHFLFNSLNILSALVKDNHQAKEYILKLSHVYRYLLQNNDSITTKLIDELDFAQQYIFLQKIRFTEGLNIQIEVDDKYLEHLMPSYSMQIIIENIFKHNAVSKEFPMQINISSDPDEYLIISNTLNPKKNLFESTGTGQLNLFERYDLLCKRKPKFYIEKNLYMASIPLIPPSQNNHDSNFVT